ncbi:uncharacterized protein LOC114279078 isoform X1 [Camellia sinensis]|uniref:uncharacterized protein LOC114279078 isoform X1 n=1 Tax=Camellia sinensis TaxID=4442 RepID=UPI001035EDCB|nr:uncharacterized protein LOC114279078 isoform X1 [Camellia sinensis]
MVQTPISSFTTASTTDLMSSLLVIQREPREHIKDEDIKKNYCILLWGDMASSSNVFCHQSSHIKERKEEVDMTNSMKEGRWSLLNSRFVLSLALLRALISSFKQVSFGPVFGIKFSATSQGLISVSCNKLSLFCR